ncbi:phage tail protein [Salinivibrio kushneri]|uniref:Phage tail fibre protein N-terminal domain-containing protein n=1 Tax=Salinivibrio kushneri TaxID=1908198 RepID=A0AB36K8W5_9GAMM|nr:phage tail protein [Salinivibrio kushneri]OOE45130.1 hypothetical protein BZG09_05345 [Salinivibrio kushneri]
MSQTAIPLQFEKYLRDKVSLGKAPKINEMIFAYIPDLDPSQPIDRSQGLPPMSQWVYQRTIDQVGKMGDNALAYSVVVPDSEDAFTFNAIFMRDKDVPDSCAFVVHKADETKEVGSTLTRTLVMEFDGAAELAGIHVDAETWQIDYSARLLGMDEDLRLACFDIYGHTAYINGFDVSRHTDPNKYIISAGVVYVGGLRFELPAQLVQTVIDKPATLYVEVYRDGTALSVWKNHGQVIASQSPMADHTNANGRHHYVTKLAHINSDGSIEDLRQRGGLQAHLDAEDPHSQYIPKSAIATIEEAKQGKKGKVTDAEGMHAAFNLFGFGDKPLEFVPDLDRINLSNKSFAFTSDAGVKSGLNLAGFGELRFYGSGGGERVLMIVRTIEPTSGDILGTFERFSNDSGNTWTDWKRILSSLDKADTPTAQAGLNNEYYMTPFTTRQAIESKSKLLGEPFRIFDHLEGSEKPNNSGVSKYIKLTAGEDGAGGFNEGLLINETTSGSGPTVEITAEIAKGPMAGEIVNLVNSEKRHIAPGENSGTVHDDHMQVITGAIEFNFDLVDEYYRGAIRPSSGDLDNIIATAGTRNSQSDGINFDSSWSPDARTSDRTDVKRIEATYYMRIV